MEKCMGNYFSTFVEEEGEIIANYRFLPEGWNLHMATLKLKHMYESIEPIPFVLVNPLACMGMDFKIKVNSQLMTKHGA